MNSKKTSKSKQTEGREKETRKSSRDHLLAMFQEGSTNRGGQKSEQGEGPAEPRRYRVS